MKINVKIQLTLKYYKEIFLVRLLYVIKYLRYMLNLQGHVNHAPVMDINALQEYSTFCRPDIAYKCFVCRII